MPQEVCRNPVFCLVVLVYNPGCMHQELAGKAEVDNPPQSQAGAAILLKD
jgi:hypothetical protein